MQFVCFVHCSSRNAHAPYASQHLRVTPVFTAGRLQCCMFITGPELRARQSSQEKDALWSRDNWHRLKPGVDPGLLDRTHGLLFLGGGGGGKKKKPWENGVF